MSELNDSNKKEKTIEKTLYKWIYDIIISKFYDIGLKIGLTPPGEYILRISVFDTLTPIIKKGDRILDIGCGTGTLMVMLSRLIYSDCKLIGVDLSHGQITQAKKKNHNTNLKFEIMDGMNLKFKNESFNIVIISAVLHEMNKLERIKVLNEAYRVLKNKGYLLIFEHHEPSKTSLRIYYNFYLGFWERIFSNSFDMQRKILFELKMSGFNIIDQNPIKKFHNFFQIILCQKY